MKISPINFNNSKMALQNKESFCHTFKNQQKADTFEVSDEQINRLVNKRLLELNERQVSASSLVEITILDEHEYQKALYLLDKGVENESIKNYLKLEDEKYIKLLKLLKLGIPSFALDTILNLNEENFEVAIQLFKSGAQIREVNNFHKIFDKKPKKDILNLINNGVNYYFARNCSTMPYCKITFLEFKRKGYDDLTSSIFANSKEIKNLDDEAIKSFSNAISLIRKNSRKTYNFSIEFSDFIKRILESKDNPKEFEEYISKIDFEKLYKIAPILKKYTDCELLNFLETHFIKGSVDFNKEDLIFENLNEFLSENYLNSKDINNLLNSYPLTSRQIGEIPSGWLEKINDKSKAQKEIYETISAFQHHKDTKLFACDLSKILNKETNVEKIGAGSYGITYKIEIENATPTVLKTFHPRDYTYNESWHGRNIEPQSALFANHNSTDYVKMYFGKVCTKAQRDGFMVTQYLDKNITPQQTIAKSNESIKIGHGDSLFDNRINGKIVDFGGMFLTKKC